jgi:DNA (cytosine-5)-methyltransferase 1
MRKPLLLDLFCGGGGAAAGYFQAGFEVLGVDLHPQPHYPYTFLQMDALEFLSELNPATTRAGGRRFVAVHASPPCQHHTALAKGTNANQYTHPELIEPTRELLAATGLPYVIENALTAPLRDPVMLCGEMFRLPLLRHRLFETNWFLPQPEHPPHRGRVAGWRHGVKYDGPYIAVYGNGGGKGSLEDWQAGMEIDWIPTKTVLCECIPPAYTRYVGKYLLGELA